MLLLHGDADRDVPHQQFVLMAAALAREGVEDELITIPGGRHGFDGEDPPGPQVASALDRVVSFLSGLRSDVSAEIQFFEPREHLRGSEALALAANTSLDFLEVVPVGETWVG